MMTDLLPYGSCERYKSLSPSNMLKFFVQCQTRLHLADTKPMRLYVGGTRVFVLLLVTDCWPGS